MFCYSVDLACDQVYGNVLDLAGGGAAIDGATFDLGAFQHDGAGCDDGIAADLGIIHDDGAHADEDLIAKLATMYDGVMADGDVVADDGLGFLVGGVYDDAVLYVDLIADADAVDVAADDGVEPDACFVAYFDVSNYGCIGGDEAVFSKFGEFTFNGEDSGHGNAFSYYEYPEIFLIMR